MPGWLSVVLGAIGGLALIAGAICLAIRPYPRHDLVPGESKPWMPDPSGRDHTDDKGAGLLL